MKNILITGGVGGIGSSISKKFLEAGFDVYSLDLVKKDFGEHFHNIICDVTSIEELAKVKEFTDKVLNGETKVVDELTQPGVFEQYYNQYGLK